MVAAIVRIDFLLYATIWLQKIQNGAARGKFKSELVHDVHI